LSVITDCSSERRPREGTSRAHENEKRRQIATEVER
jgi:hypothetical protein